MDGSEEGRADSSARSILEVVGLTILAFLVVAVVGAMFIIQLVALGYEVQTTLVLLGATGAGQLAMFALGYGYFRYRDLRVPTSIPTVREIGYIHGGVVLALGAATGLSLLLVTLDLLPSSVIGETATTNPTYLLGLAVLSVVLVAPIEEFVFRGVVQGRLREHFGPVPAIAGSSLLFGSMHLANYSGRLLPIVAGALMISVIGSIFGILYERTDNLAVPILVHAAYNAILLLVSYAATTNLNPVFNT